MAKAPRPGASTRAQAAEAVLTVGFGDRTWTLRLDAITPRDVGDLRQALGFGTREVFSALAENLLDLDIASALVFLARRQHTPRISYAQAVDGFTYTTGFTYGLAGDIEDDEDSPEV